MPAVQTTYGNMTAARVGQIAEFDGAEVLISRTVETVAGIGFGAAVFQGAADYGVVLVPSVKFKGITVRSQAKDANVGDIWPQYDDCRIMNKGVVWVQASLAVAAGDPVYCVTATGVFTNVSTSNVLVPNAMFETSTAGAGLAKVRLS